MNGPPPRDAPRNPWPFRIGFGAFLLLLGGGFFGMMTVIAPALEAWRDEDTVIYKCEEVLSGDTLKLVPVGQPPEKSHPLTLRILGIEAPPVDPAGQAEFAQGLGLAVERIPALARSSRNALSVWILKRENLLIENEGEEPPGNTSHRHWNLTAGWWTLERRVARVNTSKVDVGKIQLRHGQALATEETHAYQAPYKGYEAEAREGGFGIWRTP